MVSLSVFATVVTMNLSSRSREKVPEWLRWLILEYLSRVVCMRDYAEELTHEEKDLTSSETYCNNKIYYDNVAFNSYELTSSKLKDFKGNGTMKGKDVDSKTTKKGDAFADQWKLVGTILTRFFAVLFGLIMVVSTLVILLFIWFCSEMEFELAVGEHREEWLNHTHINNN